MANDCLTRALLRSFSGVQAAAVATVHPPALPPQLLISLFKLAPQHLLLPRIHPSLPPTSPPHLALGCLAKRVIFPTEYVMCQKSNHYRSSRWHPPLPVLL
jgi:hypothetical protein